MPLITQLSTKGQASVPAELRQKYKLEPGSRIAWEDHGDCIIVRPVTPDFIRSLRGMTKGAGELREKAHRDDKW